MSTYYQFRCPKCEEQGGFFSRQMWGWGNCDIFTNFKFVVAHAHCGPIEIVSEYDDAYFNEVEEVKWLERLASPDEDGEHYLRDEVWPHASEWDWVRESWEHAHVEWRKKLDRDLETHRKRSERK